MSTDKRKIEVEQQKEKTDISVVNRLRWVIGVVVILLGVFATLSSVSHLFSWKDDCSLLAGVVDLRPDINVSYGNICKGIGAKIGDLLIGRSFGFVGLIIPIYLLILGVNIIRGSRKLILNRDTLTMFILLILTSLTLGAVFGSSWNLYGSGLGGAFGLCVSKMLYDAIGIGLILALIGAWAATGVFINSNFIKVVNKAGSSALNSTDKFLSKLKKEKTVAAKSVDSSEGVQAENISSDIEVEVEQEQLNQVTINDIAAQQLSSNVVESTESLNPTVESQGSEDIDTTSDDDSNPFFEVIGSAQHAAKDIEDGAKEDDSSPFDEIIKSLEGSKCETIEECVAEAEDLNSETEGAVVFVEVNKVKSVSESDIDSGLYDPTKDVNNYVAPPVSLLEDYQTGAGITDAEIFENKSLIEETLNHFGIPIQQHIKATVGPTITLYEIVQASGVKISKIQGLENDIAQNLKASGIRIIAPIPGAGTIGIELPNRCKQIVSMRSAILSKEFQTMKAQLPIVIGRTIQNDNYVFDLAKMPHLLVAGATGQGKSVGLNAIITSLLYRKHPSELKFVMIDPKMVEFSPYKSLENHYMAKMESEEDVIITDPKKAVCTLNAICEEMENRLRLLSQAGVRNIVEYNDKFKRRVLNPDKGHFFMPYIVVIIDEFADLIMTAKEVELPVMRIAQKARAVGIHLIVATQRPDVKVITGGIKANFPARIAFKVTQMIDSRTIIDQPGANQLIGRGDMLFSKDGELTRIQCALVETDEVARIVDHIGRQQGYSGAYRLPDYSPDSGSGDFDAGDSSPVIKYDALFAEIARAAVSNGGISTSAIQRNFEVGFNRAGRIMTQLERAGIVGRQEGSKPRDILFYDMPSLEAKLQELGIF
ncbi:MAG: DNA translocase FtsK 4TM domain-containing protein [Rikenellaceae bacterium]